MLIGRPGEELQRLKRQRRISRYDDGSRQAPGAGVMGLAATSAALRVVVRRPRSGADSARVAAADALRHGAARTITGASGILVTLPLAGACLLTAGSLLSLPCRPTWSTFT